MNFQWADFLALATEWVNNPTSSSYPQALYRSVISRAYYAVYHSAEELAYTLGLQFTSSASDHFRLRKFYENRGRVAKQLSLFLYDLYRLRISADYVLDVEDDVARDPQRAAQRALEAAHKAQAVIEYLQPKAR
jgi:uncharacterized protein (UPF0332 family)